MAQLLQQPDLSLHVGLAVWYFPKFSLLHDLNSSPHLNTNLSSNMSDLGLPYQSLAVNGLLHLGITSLPQDVPHHIFSYKLKTNM